MLQKISITKTNNSNFFIDDNNTVLNNLEKLLTINKDYFQLSLDNKNISNKIDKISPQLTTKSLLDKTFQTPFLIIFIVFVLSLIISITLFKGLIYLDKANLNPQLYQETALLLEKENNSLLNQTQIISLEENLKNSNPEFSNINTEQIKLAITVYRGTTYTNNIINIFLITSLFTPFVFLFSRYRFNSLKVTYLNQISDLSNSFKINQEKIKNLETDYAHNFNLISPIKSSFNLTDALILSHNNLTLKETSLLQIVAPQCFQDRSFYKDISKNTTTHLDIYAINNEVNSKLKLIQNIL